MEEEKPQGNRSRVLDSIFIKLHSTLEQMDRIRESILQQQRKTIRLCSELIKDVHRGVKGSEPIETTVKQIKKEFNSLLELVAASPLDFSKDYRTIAAQEVGEALIFKEIIQNDRFPQLEDIGITELEYAYALCDVVGELRRYILKLIREEDIERSFELFNYMTEIYRYLFTLDYPGGLIPGLRKKIDTARSIIGKTEGDITLSGTILKLTRKLDIHPDKQ